MFASDASPSISHPLLTPAYPPYPALESKFSWIIFLHQKNSIFNAEVPSFERLWDVEAFRHHPKASIKSSGYVVDTLEAVLWCLLNTASYPEAVLTAVNLGDDTDTIGAIVGGLAGVAYGCDSIPSHWQETLLKKDLIEGLCAKFI